MPMFVNEGCGLLISELYPSYAWEIYIFHFLSKKGAAISIFGQNCLKRLENANSCQLLS